MACVLLTGARETLGADGKMPPPVYQDVLSPAQWVQVENSIDRGLQFLLTQQGADGAFTGPTPSMAQPAVTSFCVLALLARGHLPGEGAHGEAIGKGVDFVLSCRQDPPFQGLLTYQRPYSSMMAHTPSHTAIYNHAIGGLLLSETYGMGNQAQTERSREVIEAAIEYTLRRQQAHKDFAEDQGGWRYIYDWQGSDSDLSVTSWQLLFLRSSRNAGFEVPSSVIDSAIGYVNRCFDENNQTFVYGIVGQDRHITRAMAGCGVLALSLGGLHETPVALSAGDWILDHNFDTYLGNAGSTHDTWYFYGSFYCSQAMFQLGGDHWRRFYPGLVDALVANQHPDGSWDPEPGGDTHFGNVYTTALAVLALSTPYQLLPIYQR